MSDFALAAEQVVGRDAELDCATRFFEGVLEGPAALMFDGDPGIGKTVLWRAAVARALALEFQVLSCFPAEHERRVPFAGLGDLLTGSVDEVLAMLPAPQARALAVALLRAEPTGRPPDWRAVAVAVLGVLQALAASGPVLVAIDDAQWLDPPTVRVLEFSVRRLRREPVGVLLTRRGQQGEAAPLGLDRVLSDARLTRVLVEPLQLDAIHRVIRSRLGVAFPRPTLLRIHGAAAGNPFLALEIARALQRRGGKLEAGEPLPVPHDIRALLRARLDRLPVRTRAALEFAAAMSRPTVSLVIQAVAQGERTTGVLDRAVVAGVIEVDRERFRFTHPLLASVLYGSVPPARRRSIHRRLAEVVPSTEEQARHLALGSAAAADAGVAEALEGAAGQARARGAPDAAAELAELACRLTGQDRPEDARRRRIACAYYHLAAGDTGRARVLLDGLVAASSPGPQRAEALLRLAAVRYHEDSLTEALSLLEQALASAGNDPAVLAWSHYYLSQVLMNLGRLSTSELHARQALRLAEPLGEPALLCQTIAAVVDVESCRGRGIRLDALRRAVALERAGDRPVVELRPSALRGALLTLRDELGQARACLVETQRLARDRGDEGALAGHLFWLSEVESRAGQFPLAATLAAEGCEVAARAGHEPHLAQLLAARAMAEAHRGRVEAARAAAGEGLALATRLEAVFPTIRTRAVLGYVALSVGDLEGAVSHLDSVRTAVVTAGFGEPGHFLFSANLIEALLSVGELEQAERHLAWLEERGRALDRPWAMATGARCRGLLHAARGDRTAALASLETSLAHHRRLPMPLELGRTLLAKGRIERRARHKALARQSLEAALGTFEQLGATLWAERTKEDLGRVGLRPPTPLALTVTQQRVAELVAAGHSNREVAERLFLSVNTVEDNLKKIYRKLGIRSRTQLIVRLGSPTTAPIPGIPPPPAPATLGPSQPTARGSDAQQVHEAADS